MAPGHMTWCLCWRMQQQHTNERIIQWTDVQTNLSERNTLGAVHLFYYIAVLFTILDTAYLLWHGW